MPALAPARGGLGSLAANAARLARPLGQDRQKALHAEPGGPFILNGITKLRKFQRCSTLKPVEPVAAIFAIFKNLMSLKHMLNFIRFLKFLRKA
jgi:hypothetical protein